ncbi:MAG: xylulokinase [Chloroflexota bacterium]
MTRLLGIDLGTSSVKAVVIDEHTRLLGIGSREYPIDVPQPGYAEQDSEAWWQATIHAVRQAIEQADSNEGSAEIDAIGLAGHMHGTLLLDASGQALAPAIIWADQRGAAEVGEIISIVGTDQLARIAGTAPAAGFMAPTLRWLQKHNPALLEQARYCLLPKDYVRFRLTDEIATDASDASATALFDVRQRQWSTAIIETLDLPDLWPNVFESADIVGALTKSAAETLGLTIGIPVAAGSADQPAQAVGNGLINPGIGSVTLGTGGQIFAPLLRPQVDNQLRLHVFCHAPADRWYLLGAMLSAGLSLRWLRDLHGLTNDPNAYQYLADLANGVPLGAEGLLFMPYLVGERAPLMDPLARGGFVGLTLGHGLGHLSRAIMEGVAFALRQILDVMIDLNTPVEQLLASGGGLASPIWRQIVADVLARPLRLSTGRERAAVGAAVIAGIGIGIYADYSDSQQAVAAPFELTEPDPQRAAFYAEQYARFVQLYPLLKSIFHDLQR